MTLRAFSQAIGGGLFLSDLRPVSGRRLSRLQHGQRQDLERIGADFKAAIGGPRVVQIEFNQAYTVTANAD